MTTIISLNGKLYGDRRVVVNYRNQAMVGVQDGAKISGRLPFCLYGSIGFNIRQGGILQLANDRALALIFGLLYFKTKKFRKHLLYKHVRKVPNFFNIVGNYAQVVSETLNSDLIKNKSGIIAISKEHTLSVGINAGFAGIISRRDDCVVVGSGAKVACILLENEFTVAATYKALRTSGVPSGVEYDTLSTSDLPDLFPPVCDPGFIASIAGYVADYFKGATSDSPEEKEKFIHEFIVLLSVLWMLGQLDEKTNTVNFNQKHINNDFKQAWDKDSPHYQASKRIFEKTLANERY